MSHYSLLVITDKECDESILAEIMSPYDENIVVPKYISKTKSELANEYKEMVRDLYEYNLKNDDSILAASWKEKFDSYTDDDSVIKSYKEDYPDEEFDENDNLLSTYNPNSKYDWYDIGGRFSEQLKLKDGTCVNQAYAKDVDFQMDRKKYQDYIRLWELAVEGQNLKKGEKVPFCLYKPEYYTKRYKDKETFAKLMSGLLAYAVLDENGWHEKGEMGWFGVSDTTADQSFDWDMNFYDRYIVPAIEKNRYLTIVDCHI